MEGNLVVRGFAVLLLLGLPALAAKDADRELPEAEMERAAEFRRAIYVSIAISLLVVAGVTLAVAAWQRVPGEAVGWAVGSAGSALAWSAGTAAIGLGAAWLISVAGGKLGLAESRVAYLLMPRDAREKRAFVLLAGVGAVCEEYVYRGFTLHVLAEWLGSPWLAVGLTAISFGLSHGYQRLTGILRATVLGVVLAVPVVRTASLFPAIVGHFWINGAIGLGGWRRMIPESSIGGRVSEDEPGRGEEE